MLFFLFTMGYLRWIIEQGMVTLDSWRSSFAPQPSSGDSHRRETQEGWVSTCMIQWEEKELASAR